MQIVEYLYATLFGNDLHVGSNFSTVVAVLYSSNTECHLIVEPREIFPPYISAIYH